MTPLVCFIGLNFLLIIYIFKQFKIRYSTLIPIIGYILTIVELKIVTVFDLDQLAIYKGYWVLGQLYWLPICTILFIASRLAIRWITKKKASGSRKYDKNLSI